MSPHINPDWTRLLGSVWLMLRSQTFQKLHQFSRPLLFFFLSRWIHIPRRQQQQPLSLLRAAGSSHSPAALRASSSSRRGALRAADLWPLHTALCPAWRFEECCTAVTVHRAREQSAVGADMWGHAEAPQRRHRDAPGPCCHMQPHAAAAADTRAAPVPAQS